MSNWYFDNSIEHSSLFKNPKNTKNKKKTPADKSSGSEGVKAYYAHQQKQREGSRNTAATQAQESSARQQRYLEEAEANKSFKRKVRDIGRKVAYTVKTNKEAARNSPAKRNSDTKVVKAVKAYYDANQQKKGEESRRTAATQAQEAAQRQKEYTSDSNAKTKDTRNQSSGSEAVKAYNAHQQKKREESRRTAANQAQKSSAVGNNSNINASNPNGKSQNDSKRASNIAKPTVKKTVITHKSSPDDIYNKSKVIFSNDKSFMKNYQEYLNVMNYYANTKKFNDKQLEAYQRALMEVYNSKV